MGELLEFIDLFAIIGDERCVGLRDFVILQGTVLKI